MTEGPARAWPRDRRPGCAPPAATHAVGGSPGPAVAGGRAAIAAALVAALVAGALAGCGAAEPAEDPAAGTWVAPSSTPLPGTGPDEPAATTAAPPVPATPSRATSTAPSPAAKRVRYAFPVQAEDVAYHPTHGKYPATDIFADCGAPVVAAVDGTVLEVSRTDEYVEGAPDGPRNGGLSVSILGADGVRYYGSHLSRIAAGIDPGVTVEAGRRIGDLGRTGNANNVCHLHFGISPPCARTGDWKVRRGVVWPKPYLDSWRRGGARSAAGAAKDWAAKHGCRA